MLIITQRFVRHPSIIRYTNHMSSIFENRNMIWLDDVSSTMDVAKEFIISKGGEPFAVVANRQLSGRGTRGRAWNSELGNLYMTVGFPVSAVKMRLTLVPLRLVYVCYIDYV